MKLRISTCETCRREFYPSRHLCPDCLIHTKEVESEVERGEVVTWTTVYVPPPDFSAPLHILVVKSQSFNIMCNTNDTRCCQIGTQVLLTESEGRVWGHYL